jgi:IS605 OrfB family transposase
MEVTKTIKAKIMGLTNIKREALESEYANYQKAVCLSEDLIRELDIRSLKQATDLLYKRGSEHSLLKQVSLYSATYQMAYRKAMHTRGRSRKEQPLRLRHDTFDVKRFPNEIAAYWAKIPVYGNHGGVKVALRMSPKHEDLLQDPEIRICDSELLKRGEDFYLHITVKKCVDIAPKRSGRLAIIGIDAGIRNTATSVVWRDDSITGVKMHSGNRLAHKTKQAKDRLAKSHRHAFKHNDYHCVEKALDRETEIGLKLSNYTRDHLHKLSSGIVEQAIELRRQGYDVVIACENLKHIRQRISGKLQWWAFRQLLGFVRYKAQWAGIQFAEVEPANTSRTCPKCGHCDKNNRQGLNFICTECGYNAHADLVGAANVATRFLASLELYAHGKGRCESAQEVVSAEPQALTSGQTRRRHGL